MKNELPEAAGRAVGLSTGLRDRTSFLAQIQVTRADLARHLVRENPNFAWSDSVLNNSVQWILGRILFVRLCEAHGFVESSQLQVLLQNSGPGNGDNLYARLMAHFRSLDSRFRGLLFRTPGPEVHLSDRALSELAGSLCSGKTAHELSLLPAEVLGDLYEKSIGVVAELGKNGARFRHRPEGRKANGIYYTPRYVVDHIVEETIGDVVRGKHPDDLENVTVVDPACGAGCFLIAAFDRICREYLRWFAVHPQGRKEEWCCRNKDGKLRLTLRLKSDVLRRSIFGVDLDPQAVETTIRSLYLKILEGENRASVDRHRGIFGAEAMFPDLSCNVKSGNSIVGKDCSPFFREEMGRAFEWSDEFPAIIGRGGFDAVVGNPPYYSIDTMGRNSPEAAYLRWRYPEVWSDKTDILNYFLFLGLSLTRRKLGMIVSRAFLEGHKSARLRDALRKNAGIQSIVDFGDFRVFDAGVSTAILVLDKQRPRTSAGITVRRIAADACRSDVVSDLADSGRYGAFDVFKVRQSNLTAGPWNLWPPAVQGLFRKIDERAVPLGALFEIGQGMQTGCNEVFGGLTRDEVRRLGLGDKWSRKRASNSDITRYAIRDRGEYLLWVEDASEWKELPAQVRSYLLRHKAKLMNRAACQRHDCEWWKFTWPLHKELYSREKIVAPFLASGNHFALDRGGRFLGLTDTIALFKRPEVKEDILYFLALLNSRLLEFRFKGMAKLKGGGIYEYFANSVSRIPIRRIDFADARDLALYKRLVQLAHRMVELTPGLPGATRKGAQRSPNSENRPIDREIDARVCELYGIEEQEIRSHNGAAGAHDET